MDRNCETCSQHAGKCPLRCARAKYTACRQVCHRRKACNPTKQKQGQWICRSCTLRDINNNNSNESHKSLLDTNLKRLIQDGQGDVLFDILINDFRKHRELQGHYNYLISDPSYHIHDFSSFCGSIIYIGKGQRTRYEAHFKNAKDGKKEQEKRILKIWKSGKQPILLKIFKNRSSHEAHTKEKPR